MARPTRPPWTTLPLDPDGDRGVPVVRLVVGLVSVSAAAAGAAVLLANGPVVLGFGLGGVAVAVAGAQALRRRPIQVLGSFVLVRSLLAVGVAAFYSFQSPPDRTPAWLTAAALLLVVVVEPLIRRVTRGQRLYQAHLPGSLALPAGTVAPWTVPAAGAAATLLGVLLAVLGLNAWIWLASLIAVLVLAGGVLFGALRQIPLDRQSRRSLREDLTRYAPEFVIYTARPDDASYQIRMWLPYLQRSGRRFVIITRQELPARVLAEVTDVPVICCRTSQDIERALVPSLTTVFYVNASSGNGEMVRHSHLTHVYVGHGDSDKAPSYNPTHAMYDKIFAAGQAAIDRYAAHGVSIPGTRFAIVGRPQVEDVEPAAGPIATVTEPTVLYAPTWRGHVDETMLYSLPQGERIVRALLARGATVVFRPHPFSRDEPEDAARIQAIQTLLGQDTAATGRRHVFGPAAETDLSIFDCMNRSDAMVSDVSSVVSDYLQSQKPFAMYVPTRSATDFVHEFPVARAAYLLDSDLADLAGVLDSLLATDPARQSRQAVRVEYLGDFPTDRYADAFVAEVDRTVAAVGVRRDAAEEDIDHLDAGLSDADLDDPGDEVERGAHDEADEAEPVAADIDDTADVDPESAALSASVPVTTSAGSSPRAGAIHSPAAPDAASPGMAQMGADESDARGAGDASSLEELETTLATGRRRSLVPIYRYQFADALSVTLAAASAVTAFSDAEVWVPIALAAVVLGWLGWIRPPWRALSKTRMLGAFAGQRCLITLCTYGLFLRDDDSAVAAGAALVMFLVVLAGESWLRIVLDTPRLRLFNMPLMRYSPTALGVHRWVYPIAMAALVVNLVIAVAHGPVWAATAVAGILLLGLLALLTADVRLFLASEQARRELPGVLAEYGAQFAVYFASVAGARYQIGMWMPYFERIGRPFIVIVRYSSSMGPIAELTSAPILLCPTLRSLEEAISPDLSTVFYVNNGLKNTHFVERRELTHIWLNHGDSEKPACFNPVHAIYDRIFAAGQAGIDRYHRHGVDISPEKFEIVGRPQVETIERAKAPIGTLSAPTVLYAPTWVGPFADSNVYSLPVGAEIVQALLDRGCTVIFRAHPLNYRFSRGRQYIREISAILEQDRLDTGRPHLWRAAAERDLTIEDCFNASDAMVSDVSAVVSDYLFSEKPFSMVAMQGSSDQLIADAPVAVASYILAGDLSNLGQTLDDLLVNDPLGGQRRETKRYYLGDTDTDNYADGFLTAARRHIDAAGRDAQVLGAH